MTAMDADPREPRKAVERALAKAARQINASLDYYDELGFARDVLDALDANPEAKAALAAWTATPAETGLRERISEARLALLDKPDPERAVDILEGILSQSETGLREALTDIIALLDGGSWGEDATGRHYRTEAIRRARTALESPRER